MRFRLRRRLGAGDRLAAVVLTLVPTVIAFGPTLAGRSIMSGDNLTQNYPLRVLVGQILRHGALPWWNPMMWSGTPLMAGWNAGAGFPGTWLFAVLPAPWAWSFNLAFAGLAASLGTYVFLRRMPVAPTGAFIGAATFALTGFVVGQGVHYGLVVGTALIPVLLAAVDTIAKRSTEGSLADCLPAVLCLAVASALVVLSGEPRAVSNAALLLGVYVLACCWRSPASAPRFLLAVAAAGALALALSAVQLLPGIQFLQASERGQSGYTLFKLGSIAPPWLVLFLVPYALGGQSGSFLRVYIGPLNLPELSYAVGLLPLVAFVAMVPRALVRGSKDQLGVWYLLALGGLVLSLGTYTPFGHVLWHIPLFGGQRLQNRNIAITDFALSVIVAKWAGELTAKGASAPPATASGPSPGRVRPRPAERVARIASIAPVLGTLVTIAAVLADPLGFEHWMRSNNHVSQLGHELLPYLIPAGVIALAVGIFVVVGRRIPLSARRVVLVGLSVCEVSLYAINGPFALAPPTMIATTNPQVRQLASLTGAQGRYAFYDPHFYIAPSSLPIAEQLGFFDLGILHGIASVQGYGSVLSATYQNETLTHEVGNLALPVLSGGGADTLDLRVLVTSPLYLANPIPVGAAIPVALPNGSSFDVGKGEHVYPGENAARTGPFLIAPGASEGWFLPAPEPGTVATVVFDGVAGPAPSTVSVAFFTASGRKVSEVAPVAGSRAVAASPKGFVAVRVVVSVPKDTSQATIGAVVASDSAGGNRQILDGTLQKSITAPHWRFAEMIGPLPAFLNTMARGPAWVVPVGSPNADAPLLAGGVASTPPVPVGRNEVTTVVAPSRATLVRSVAFSPGWYAEIRPSTGGATKLVPVTALGIVQAVTVPAGRSVVTFVYRPGSVRVGELAGAAGFVALIGLSVLAAFRRRSRSGPFAARRHRVGNHAHQSSRRARKVVPKGGERAAVP